MENLETQCQNLKTEL